MAENNGMELAKAYVQIIPSMEGMKGRMGQLLDDEMGNAGENAGSSLGNKLVGKVSAIISAAAIGKVVADSFMEGAALEQSLGGVETMFKENADKVIRNADKAYKTAGRSANDYMETVTGFSAALIKSLGGDTAAAAEYADMAIVDMSDNVNKFGSDIESVNNAYAGFARQNYTMLENLNLGYGGTKEGMEQLLKDAEALADKEFDISSYSDIIEAIHTIQEDLDITGTTAEEAASTFSGSFASMKAAAKNLLGDLTTGRDTQEAIDGLAKSAGDFADNVIRMSRNMIDALGELDDQMTGAIAEKLGVDQQALEGLIKTIEIGVGALLAYKAAMEISAAASAAAAKIAEVNAAMQESGSLMQALNVNPYAMAIAGAAALGMAVKALIDYQTDQINELTDRYEGLTDEQKKFLDLSDEVLAAVSSNASERSKSTDEMSAEIERSENLINTLYELDKAEKLSAADKAEMTALIEELNGVYPELNVAIDKETGHLKASRSEMDKLVGSRKRDLEAAKAQEQIADIEDDLANAKRVLTEAEEKYNAAKAARTALDPELESTRKEIELLDQQGSLTDEQVVRYSELKSRLIELTEEQGNATNAVGETAAAYSAAAEAVDTLTGELDSAREAMADTEAEEEAAQRRQELYDNECKVAKETARQFKDYVATVGGETYNISQETYDKIQELTEKYGEAVQAQEQAISSSLDVFGEFNGGTETSAQELIDNLDENQKGLENWAANLRTLAEWGVDQGLLNTLEEAGPSSASKVQAMIDMGKPKMKAYSDQWVTLQGEIHNIAEQQSQDVLDETTEMIANMIGIADKGKDDAKGEYRELADMVIQGYADGIRTGTDEVIVPVTAEMVQKAIQAAKEEAGIASPSKVFRQLGLYNDEGFALGMSDGEDGVSAAAANMVQSAIGAAEKAGKGLVKIFPDGKTKSSSKGDLLTIEPPDSEGKFRFDDRTREKLIKQEEPDRKRNTDRSYRSDSASSRNAEIKLVLPGSSGQVVASWLLPYLDIEMGRSVTINARTGAGR